MYIEASELGDDSTGSYTVKASLVTTPDDYSDDRAGATALTLGVAKSGNIEEVSDQDYFKIDLVAGQRYLFEMTASGTGSLDTAYLYLYNSSGYIIDHGYGSDLATFSYVATNSGTIYLEASELGDDSTGSYTVKALLVNDTNEPTGEVIITGTVEEYQTLSVTNTLADVDGLGTITYQWQANYVNIIGATGNTLVLGEAQVGKAISVTASYMDGHNTAESVASAATGAVINVNDAPTGSVTISGTPQQGQTLTATNTLADADGLGSITYQWKADSSVISGTGNVLVLGETQFGKAISVTASYNDGHGTAEGMTSAATGAVTPLDNHHTLTGNITFWKTGALLNDVTVQAVATTNTDTANNLIEFRNIELHADGSPTVEIWKTASQSTIENFDFELELQAGSVASWESLLPNGWLSVDDADEGFFSVNAASSDAPLSAGIVKLGTLTLTQPTDATAFTLSLVDGIVGTTEAAPFTITSQHTVSDELGNYHFTNLQESAYTVHADRAYNSLNDAVTSADALAALKIAVGLTPNADGSAILPYQYLAADVTHDGRVRSTDALAILKMAAHIATAPDIEWIFVSEEEALSSNMSRKAVDWSVADIDITLDSDVELDLIGIIKGDVI